jgi:hypothetical protein
MTAQKREKRPSSKPEYKRSARELAALQKLDRGLSARAPRVRFSGGENSVKITIDHEGEVTGTALLAEALGTRDLDFFRVFLSQLINAGSSGTKADEAGINFMLSIVKDIKPRDQLEAMLAAQMAAVHMATMRFARRLAQVENIPQQDSAERAFNKLARTFAVQMETLKRYRTGGEQKVTVQHVSVGEGGQAIVGNVTQGQREPPPAQAAASPLAITDAKIAPMARIDEGDKQVAAPVRRKSTKE